MYDLRSLQGHASSFDELTNFSDFLKEFQHLKLFGTSSKIFELKYFTICKPYWTFFYASSPTLITRWSSIIQTTLKFKNAFHYLWSYSIFNVFDLFGGLCGALLQNHPVQEVQKSSIYSDKTILMSRLCIQLILLFKLQLSDMHIKGQ